MKLCDHTDRQADINSVALLLLDLPRQIMAAIREISTIEEWEKEWKQLEESNTKLRVSKLISWVLFQMSKIARQQVGVWLILSVGQTQGMNTVQ